MKLLFEVNYAVPESNRKAKKYSDCQRIKAMSKNHKAESKRISCQEFDLIVSEICTIALVSPAADKERGPPYVSVLERSQDHISLARFLASYTCTLCVGCLQSRPMIVIFSLSLDRS